MRMLRKGEPAVTPGPLIVSGLLSEPKGVSQAARLTLAGLQAAGFATVSHDLRPVFDAGPGRNLPLPAAAPGGVWIIHVNAPEAIAAMATIDPAAWRGRYRIGYWAYELPRVPAAWAAAAAAFHEIWAPSRFVADALAAAGVRTPVRVMPHPVSLGTKPVAPARARFGLDANAFAALAVGDLLSSATRKNLIGAIGIFREAFPAPGSARLLVKTQSGDAHRAFEAAAVKAAGGRNDIVFLPDSLSANDMSALIASADVLLSPHRAEGFGLPLAEAFLAGVPALATGWSGNLDFMSSVPELLIRHTMTPVRDAYGVYAERRLAWAEPGRNDAAQKLRTLAESPALCRELAIRGRHAVEALAGAWSTEALKETCLGRLIA